MDRRVSCIQAADLILTLPAPVLPPWRPYRLYGNDHPLEIDAGCGKGSFLLARAASHPHTNFLGIERQRNRVQSVARKAVRANLSNIRLIQADIGFILAHCLLPDSVQTLYIFYPDPWPKRRHHKRRLIQPAFLPIAARVLVPGGKLHFATDDVDYTRAARRHFEGSHLLAPCPPFLPAPSEKTDFERIFERQGCGANRLSCQKPCFACG